MTRLLPSFVALALLTALAPSSARADEFGDVADLATKELWSRQTDDGAYGDVLTTARSLSALRKTPRAYGVGDGPLVREALVWLDGQFDENGLCTGVLPSQLGLAAAWCHQAVAGLRDPMAEALAARCQKAMARHPLAGNFYGDAGWGLDAIAGPDEKEALAILTRRLGSERPEIGCGEMIAALEVLAAKAADQRFSVTVGRRWHEGQFAQVAGTILARRVAPRGALATLDTADLCDVCRCLSLCSEHAVADPSAGGEAAASGTRVGAVSTNLRESYEAAADRALEYLETQQAEGRFEYFGRPDPGVTAMSLTAVLQTCRRLGRPAPPWVDSGLDWLVSLQDEDGSIHDGNLKVYITSTSILALTVADRGEEDRAVVAKANAYLIAIQSDEGEGFDSERDAAYGGIGYGGDLRPDMSNTQFATEALATSKAEGRQAAFNRALLFLQRCQNDPESNDMVIEREDGRKIEPGTDGGAVYYPGNSKAGLIELENGNFVARSYGSMTYALLKCYLMCGLPAEDPRVKAALHWIEKNYTLDFNPGFDAGDSPNARYQGLYYYYFTMAKALDLSGLESLKTPDGRRHAWREEMVRHLLQDRFSEGYWSNDRSARWWEELPTLATAYALTALDHCLGEDG